MSPMTFSVLKQKFPNSKEHNWPKYLDCYLLLILLPIHNLDMSIEETQV